PVTLAHDRAPGSSVTNRDRAIRERERGWIITPPEPGLGMVRSGLIRGRIPIVVAVAWAATTITIVRTITITIIRREAGVTVLQAVAEHDAVGRAVRYGGRDGAGPRVRVEHQDVGGIAAGGVQGTVVGGAARIEVGGVRRVGRAEVRLHLVLADRHAVVRPAGAG